MKILKITEQEDGSAIVEFDFSEEEIKLLLEYAVVDILKKYIKSI